MIRVNVLSQPRVHVQVDGLAAGHYGGQYEVTPELEAKTLETAGKLLTDNVTILPIPIHRTENSYGTTVCIGGVADG